jgi:hypothetical protein
VRLPPRAPGPGRFAGRDGGGHGPFVAVGDDDLGAVGSQGQGSSLADATPTADNDGSAAVETEQPAQIGDRVAHVGLLRPVGSVGWVGRVG